MLYIVNNVPEPLNFHCDDMTQRTIQNAKNLLMCGMGELPYDRYRGFDMSLYDLPMEQFKFELLPELDRLMMWEPDVTVVDADAERMENGFVVITMTIEVRE